MNEHRPSAAEKGLLAKGPIPKGTSPDVPRGEPTEPDDYARAAETTKAAGLGWAPVDEKRLQGMFRIAKWRSALGYALGALSIYLVWMFGNDAITYIKGLDEPSTELQLKFIYARLIAKGSITAALMAFFAKVLSYSVELSAPYWWHDKNQPLKGGDPDADKGPFVSALRFVAREWRNAADGTDRK